MSSSKDKHPLSSVSSSRKLEKIFNLVPIGLDWISSRTWTCSSFSKFGRSYSSTPLKRCYLQTSMVVSSLKEICKSGCMKIKKGFITQTYHLQGSEVGFGGIFSWPTSHGQFFVSGFASPLGSAMWIGVSFICLYKRMDRCLALMPSCVE